MINCKQTTEYSCTYYYETRSKESASSRFTSLASIGVGTIARINEHDDECAFDNELLLARTLAEWENDAHYRSILPRYKTLGNGYLTC